MAEFNLTFTTDLGDDFGSLELPPGTDNPLIQWNQGYGLESLRAARPSVSETGDFRGNTWGAYKPAYTRKDGTVVPIWGGVPKVRGRGNVKPRKRPSGAPYSQNSKQMQDLGDMFQDFYGSDPELDQNNTRLTKTTNLRYAPVQDSRRPFIWGPRIEQEESDRLEAAVLAFIDRRLAE